MSTQAQNKAVVQQFVHALGRGDVETLKTVMATDIQAVATGTSVFSTTRGYDDIVGAAGMLGLFTQNGIEMKIVSMTAEEDRVSCEVEGYSTLKNDAPYNNQYHFLFTLRDSKIVGLREYMCTKLVDSVLVPVVMGSAA